MMSEWLPIESAPKDGTIIDLWVGGHRIPNCSWDEFAPNQSTNFEIDGAWVHHRFDIPVDWRPWSGGYGGEYPPDPTHWMLPPDPPATPAPSPPPPKEPG